MKRIKAQTHPAQLITRKGVKELWSVDDETLKRMEREGRLHPIKLRKGPNAKVRYSMREIEMVASAIRQAAE